MHRLAIFVTWLSISSGLFGAGQNKFWLSLQARSRDASNASGEQRLVEKTLTWDPQKTALIIVDMWNDHWCKGAARRVEELAKPTNQFIAEARRRGVLIVHCPSTCLEFYKDTDARRRATEAGFAKPLIELASSPRWGTAWDWPDNSREPALPIDDSDMGCDCPERCEITSPWKRQIAAIDIDHSCDAITDNGQELVNLFAERSIENVMICGVHLNMCVLGRPFGIRQLVKLGKNVVLVRDLTDTMYNHRMRPFVDHFAGTALVVEHVEKYWCPTIVSTDLVGGVPFQFAAAQSKANDATSLPGTQLLMMEGDIASQLVEGVDRFLLRRIEASVNVRQQHWHRDFSSAEAYDKSIEPNRQRLAHVLGVRDPRVAFEEPDLVGTTSRPALVGKGAGFEVFVVRWPAFGDVTGEGLLLVPTGGKPVADVVAIPNCNQMPEQLVGLVQGVPSGSQYARRLAESGCRVIVPLLINRENRMEHLTNREWIYRSAFELGRGLVGYEVQKVLACVDWFDKESADGARIGVIGWGEGGLVALYAGALDPRIDAVCVSGYFDNRNRIWEEPIDRNVFGLLERFGDAELASMIAPRALVVEAARGPEATIPGGRGAPARVVTPELSSVRAEIERGKKLIASLQPAPTLELIVSDDDGRGPYGTEPALSAFLKGLNSNAKLSASNASAQSISALPDPAARHARQVHELDRHSQWLLRESQYVRQHNFWSKLNFESLDKYKQSIEPFREFFAEEVIGRFAVERLPPNVRSRKIGENNKWTRYEVVMDVFPDIIAYGLLTLPKGIQDGEKRPVVVCQHGLEGRPQDTIGEQGYDAYKAFNTALAERGFITFSPQNLYIFGDRFRTLQRKANPIKKTLFSIIVPQHQQIVNWLKTLPQADPNRIAFYGLSYGGKTAMRVPPLVSDYCLSICSADFNEWVDKNASTRNPHSYAGFGEYEIFEFDLGSTFNYAEMSALVAPRPFMVERGHFDGVASDETVGWEYAKVRFLYAARLKIPDRTEIEWFDGPHTINGDRTFSFLHRHLNWPEPGVTTAAGGHRKIGAAVAAGNDGQR